MTDPAKTASSVVNSAYVTTTTVDSTDLSSTDGIRRAVAANTAAIKLLAEHIDGPATPATGVIPASGSTPASITPPRNDPATGLLVTTDPVTRLPVYTDPKTGHKVDKTGKPI